MAIGADQAKFYIEREQSPGTLPGSPEFDAIRLTGDTLAQAANTTESQELDPNRQVSDSILAGTETQGGFAFEFAHNDALYELIAGVLGSDWTTDAPGTPRAITVGSTLHTYTLEKNIPTEPSGDTYHRFSGISANSLSFDVQPNQPITGAVEFVGGSLATDASPSTGNYNAINPPVDVAPVMTAPNAAISWTGGLGGLNGVCSSACAFTINANNRGIDCIGTLGQAETVLGRLSITGTATVLFKDNAALDAFLAEDTGGLNVTMTGTGTSSNGNGPSVYTWQFPRVKFTSATVLAGGTNTDIVNEIEWQALIQGTTTVTVSWNNAGP